MPPKKRGAGETNGAGKRKKRKNSDDFEEFEDEEVDNSATGDAVVDHKDGDTTDYSDVKLEGSMLSGEVLFCGGTNWDLIGRNKLPKNAKGGGPNLWCPHRLAKLVGVKIRTVVSSTGCCHCAVITTDGKVLTWGLPVHRTYSC